MTDDFATPAGFSRVVTQDDVPVAGLHLKLEADEAARAALAERFGLLSIDSLVTRVEIFPWRRTGLRVEGSFCAEVVQSCVVSLEPVPVTLDVAFALKYRPLALEGDGEKEVAVSPLGDEPPEHLPEEGIDLGEVVAEQLALALDPYPRAAGQLAVMPTTEPENAGSSEILEKKDNPFEALKNLKLNGDR